MREQMTMIIMIRHCLGFLVLVLRIRDRIHPFLLLLLPSPIVLLWVCNLQFFEKTQERNGDEMMYTFVKIRFSVSHYPLSPKKLVEKNRG